MRCEHKVWGITVEFWTVWPLIEKRRVNINTMLHASIKQHVLMWLEGKGVITSHSTGSAKVRLQQGSQRYSKYFCPGSNSICKYLINFLKQAKCQMCQFTKVDNTLQESMDSHEKGFTSHRRFPCLVSNLCQHPNFST